MTTKKDTPTPNLPAKRLGTLLTAEKREAQLQISKSNDPFLHLLDNDRWEAINRGAKIIAGGICGKHLRGANPEETMANALAVSLFASNIGWMPTLLAPEAYVVRDKVSYSAKVIYALTMAHPRLKQSLNRVIQWQDPKTGDYSSQRGPNEHMMMTIRGQLEGDDEQREIQVWWREGKKAGQTKNWDNDPITQLWYWGVKVWSRTWLPDAAMGLYTRDELEASGTDDFDNSEATHEFITEISTNDVVDVDPFEQLEEAAPDEKEDLDIVEDVETLGNLPEDDDNQDPEGIGEDPVEDSEK